VRSKIIATLPDATKARHSLIITGDGLAIDDQDREGRRPRTSCDPVVATAILERLLHHSYVITIRGDSYRLKEKRRSGLLQKPTAVEAKSEKKA
jgi:hypothetical protein